jgi:hypothetical protein
VFSCVSFLSLACPLSLCAYMNAHTLSLSFSLSLSLALSLFLSFCLSLTHTHTQTHTYTHTHTPASRTALSRQAFACSRSPPCRTVTFSCTGRATCVFMRFVPFTCVPLVTLCIHKCTHTLSLSHSRSLSLSLSHSRSLSLSFSLSVSLTHTNTHSHTNTHTHNTHTHPALIIKVSIPWLSGFLLKNDTVCTRTHLHTHMCTHAHTYTHTHIHTHTYARTHSHIQTHTSTHAHTQAVTVRHFAQERHGIACECVWTCHAHARKRAHPQMYLHAHTMYI